MHRFYTCDVFTDRRFGGNPLAVLPHAEGLSDEQMQQVAREFNYSETAFVLPAEAGHTRKVRIFTPTREVPFAGHPNVGTAFVLASTGEVPGGDVVFEEAAGLVSVAIHRAGGRVVRCELTAPQPLSLGPALDAGLVASALSLPPDDLRSEPQVASVGLPFVMVEVRSRAALERVRPSLLGFEALFAQGVRPSLHLYTRVSDGFDVRARMFAPLSGVPEDPATGSANCALAGLLATQDERPDGRFAFRIAQGVEMGRPSVLEARAEKVDGAVRETRIGGACCLVGEGFLHLED